MKKEKILLRERFINKFCKEMGWSEKKLTPEQLLLIVTNQKYINPEI